MAGNCFGSDRNGRSCLGSCLGRIEEARRLPDLGGTWYGVWDRSMKKKPTLSHEPVYMRQRGADVRLRKAAVSPDHAVGGYPW